MKRFKTLPLGTLFRFEGETMVYETRGSNWYAATKPGGCGPFHTYDNPLVIVVGVASWVVA